VILERKLPAAVDAKCQLLDETYELMLDTGFYIQPWAREKGALEKPDAHPSPRISRAVLRDGLRV
jgi:hypothetical protein